MKRRNTLIDTDMGNDDIGAIMLLLMSGRTNLLGASTVNGVSGSKTGRNNLKALLEYSSHDFPVIAGYEYALTERAAAFPNRDTERAESLTLLKPLEIKAERRKNEKTLVEDFLLDLVSREKTTIIALGPLTNLAKSISRYNRRFIKKIDRLIIMGGGLSRGNVPPFYLSEYNIWLDPEAARIVFDSGIPITLIGIDATDQVPATNMFAKKINLCRPTTPEGKILQQIITNNDGDYDAYYDLLAVAIFLNPKIITRQIKGTIAIKLTGKERGRTVLSNEEPNATTVITGVNSKLFYDTILKSIDKHICPIQSSKSLTKNI